MRIPSSLRFFGYIAAFFISLGLQLVLNAKGAIWPLPFYVFGFLIGYFDRGNFWKSFFMSLVLLGFASLTIKIFPVPLVMPFLFAGLSGSSLFSWTHNQNQYEFPVPVVVWVGALLFSWALGMILYCIGGIDPHRIVAELPWAKINLAHALGWLGFWSLTYLSGPIVFIEMKEAFAGKSIRKDLGHTLKVSILFSAFIALIQIGGLHALANASGYADRYFSVFNATFSTVNALGVSMVLLFFVIFGETSFSFLTWASGMAIVFLALVSSARSALIILTIGLFFSFIIQSRGNKGFRRIIIVGFLFLLMGGAVHIAVLKNHSRIYWSMARYFDPVKMDKPQEDANTSALKTRGLGWKMLGDRAELWKAGWVTFEHNPVLGTGLGNYLIKMPKYMSGGVDITNDLPGNVYLTVLAEQGVVGFSLFLFLLVWIVKASIRKSKESGYLDMAAFNLIGLSVAGLFGSHLSNFEINCFVWLSIALATPDLELTATVPGGENE